MQRTGVEVKGKTRHSPSTVVGSRGWDELRDVREPVSRLSGGKVGRALMSVNRRGSDGAPTKTLRRRPTETTPEGVRHVSTTRSLCSVDERRVTIGTSVVTESSTSFL